MYEFLKNRVQMHQNDIDQSSKELQITPTGTLKARMLRNRIIVAQAYQNECLCIISHLNAENGPS